MKQQVIALAGLLLCVAIYLIVRPGNEPPARGDAGAGASAAPAPRGVPEPMGAVPPEPATSAATTTSAPPLRVDPAPFEAPTPVNPSPRLAPGAILDGVAAVAAASSASVVMVSDASAEVAP